MYKRYYDGYAGNGNFKNRGEVIVPETINECQNSNEKTELTSVACDTICQSDSKCQKKGINFPFELDDLILIGILLFLLFDKDECKNDDDNDIFMLLIIGFILFSDIF